MSQMRDRKTPPLYDYNEAGAAAVASTKRALQHELAPEPRPRVDRRLVGVLVVSGLVGLLVALFLRAGGI